MTWCERLINGAMAFAMWPWLIAPGKPWPIRLLLLVFGLCWYLPMFFVVVGPVMLFVALPVGMWEMVSERTPGRHP